MPITLYTYLAAELIAPFFAGLLILSGILFMGRLMPFLDIIFDFGIHFPDFVRLSAYILPNLLVFSIPMTSMLGVIICFSRLVNDNEIMALKSCGIGLYKMLPPILFFALATATVSGLCSTKLMPEGNVAMKKLLFQLAKEKVDKGLQEKRFSEGLGDLILYVDRIDPATKTWQGVYISDAQDAESPLTIVAQTGNMSHPAQGTLTLNLLNGTLHRSDDGMTQTIDFGRYTLNLPLEGPKVIAGKSSTYIGKHGMSQSDLLREAAKAGEQTPRGLGLRIEYHRRLAMAAGGFILTLLGLPLALHARPGRPSYGLPLGLLLFVFYYILVSASKTMSESAFLPVAISMWLPNSIFGLLTILLIRNTARESSSKFIKILSAFREQIFERLQWAKRRAGR